MQSVHAVEGSQQQQHRKKTNAKKNNTHTRSRHASQASDMCMVFIVLYLFIIIIFRVFFVLLLFWEMHKYYGAHRFDRICCLFFFCSRAMGILNGCAIPIRMEHIEVASDGRN